jgi:hypothetical protein
MSIRKPIGLGLIVGILALAFAALPALASATTMDEAGGGVTPVGTAITAKSANLTFDGAVNLECKLNTLSGKLTANAPSPTVTFNKATFLNAAGGTACLTSVPGLTAVVTADPNPPAWTVTLEKEDKFTLKAESGNVAFTAVIGGALTCTFSRASVTGTYNTNSAPTTLTVGAGQVFTGAATNPKECGPEGTLTGSFTIPQKITNV